MFEVVARRTRGQPGQAAARARTRRACAGDGGGQGRAVVEAVTLRARPTVVRASGRACKVSGSTPLAALVAALDRRRIGRLCATSAAASGGGAGSSGQLFVDRIAQRAQPRPGRLGLQGQRLRALASGRADLAGRAAARGRPRAVALLRAGPATRSCQRSLRVVPDASVRTAGRVAARARARLRRRAAPRRRRPGARVTLGPATAVTDANGAATADALRRRVATTLSATAPGALPSFPVPYEVK